MSGWMLYWSSFHDCYKNDRVKSDLSRVLMPEQSGWRADIPRRHFLARFPLLQLVNWPEEVWWCHVPGNSTGSAESLVPFNVSIRASRQHLREVVRLISHNVGPELSGLSQLISRGGGAEGSRDWLVCREVNFPDFWLTTIMGISHSWVSFCCTINIFLNQLPGRPILNFHTPGLIWIT